MQVKILDHKAGVIIDVILCTYYLAVLSPSLFPPPLHHEWSYVSHGRQPPLAAGHVTLRKSIRSIRKYECDSCKVRINLLILR